MVSLTFPLFFKAKSPFLYREQFVIYHVGKKRNGVFTSLNIYLCCTSNILLAASLRNYITTDLTLRYITLRRVARFLFIIEFKLVAQVVKQSLHRISHRIGQIPSILRFDFIDTR